jgi:hypothetical protein
MNHQLVGQWKQALEQEFYGGGAGAPVSPLCAALDARRTRQELRGLLLVSEAALVDRLVQVGLTGSAAAALTLVPILEVAWADGTVQAEERRAVLGGAGELGMTAPECTELLAHWLSARPQPGMFTAWFEYARALSAGLASGEREALRDEIAALVRSVAHAAGGVMGFGRVSGAEAKALERVNAAFAS